MKYIPVALMLLTASCTSISTPETETISQQAKNIKSGFYHVADSGERTLVRDEKSGKEFYIFLKPFASVDDIETFSSKTEIDSLTQKEATEFTFQFNAKGTKDLEKGTGPKAVYDKCALIIANKVIFVVDNTSKITTGKVTLYLDEYSKEELAELKEAIGKKQ